MAKSSTLFQPQGSRPRASGPSSLSNEKWLSTSQKKPANNIKTDPTTAIRLPSAGCFRPTPASDNARCRAIRSDTSGRLSVAVSQGQVVATAMVGYDADTPTTV